MRPPLQFPSFHALVMAIENDPLLLMQSETVTVGGTIYAARHVTLHTEFQLALRQLTGAAQNSAGDQQAAGASASSTSTQQFQPATSGNCPEDDPLLEVINEWLAEQQSSASRPRVPTPAPFDPDSDVGWLDIEQWVDDQAQSPVADSRLAERPVEEVLPPELADLEQLIQDSATQPAIPDPVPSPHSPEEGLPRSRGTSRWHPFRELSEAEQTALIAQATSLFRQGVSLEIVHARLGVPYRVLTPLRQRILQHLPTRKLSTVQLEQITLTVQVSLPATHGLAGERWDVFTVKAFIEKSYRVVLSYAHAMAVWDYIRNPPPVDPSIPVMTPQQARSFTEQRQTYRPRRVEQQTDKTTSVAQIKEWLAGVSTQTAATATATATPPATPWDDTGSPPDPLDDALDIVAQWIAEQTQPSQRPTPPAGVHSTVIPIVPSANQVPFNMLNAEAQAAICQQACQNLMAGWSMHKVARYLNVSRHKVREWYYQLLAAGALSPLALSEEQLQTLSHSIENTAPRDHGLTSERWCRLTVHTFVQQRFSIEIDMSEADRILAQIRLRSNIAHPSSSQTSTLPIPLANGTHAIDITISSSRVPIDPTVRNKVMEALTHHMHYGAAAKLFGLLPTTVHRWKQTLLREGKIMVTDQNTLNDVQIGLITQIIARQRPDAHDLEGAHWSHRNLFQLVRSAFGIHLTLEKLRSYFPTLPADHTGTTDETDSTGSGGGTPPTSDDTEQ